MWAFEDLIGLSGGSLCGEPVVCLLRQRCPTGISEGYSESFLT